MVQVRSVLVLCTGNSARSILGEALFAKLGAGRLTAYSAGSKPKGVPHPGALRLLAAKGIDTAPFRSKSWLELTGPEAPEIDLAITVCGSAAGEACPVFPGRPLRAHWGLPDPSFHPGSEEERMSFALEVAGTLRRWIEKLIALPIEELTDEQLVAELRRIPQI